MLNMVGKNKKRLTYSLHPDMAKELGIASLKMSNEEGRNISRAKILDSLVSLIKDKQVYKRVKDLVK